jgi:hypothetical protein
MNQKEASVILDKMVEKSKGDWSLYMNIHKMKTEVYTILSTEDDMKESDFIEIYQKHIEESQRYMVKDLIREVSLKQIGI